MRKDNKIINIILYLICASTLFWSTNYTYASNVIGSIVSPNSSNKTTSAYAGAGYVGGKDYIFSYNELTGKYTATKLFATTVVPCKGWEKINADGFDNWYYFDENTGELKTGWFIFNNETFYAYSVNDGNIGKVYAGWHEIEGMVYYFNEETCILEKTYTMDQANALKIITPEQSARENLEALIAMNSGSAKKPKVNSSKTDNSNSKKETKETKKTNKAKKSVETKKSETTTAAWEDKTVETSGAVVSGELITNVKETKAPIADPAEYAKNKNKKETLVTPISFDSVLMYIKNILDWIVNLFK